MNTRSRNLINSTKSHIIDSQIAVKRSLLGISLRENFAREAEGLIGSGVIILISLQIGEFGAVKQVMANVEGRMCVSVVYVIKMNNFILWLMSLEWLLSDYRMRLGILVSAPVLM